MVPLPKPEPFTPADARKLIREILAVGEVQFSGHANKEMADDQLQTTDCLNVLRGGVVQPPDFEKGTWRYRVVTARICVVVAFPSATRLKVVTVWRI